jgi:hypothetical protein
MSTVWNVPFLMFFDVTTVVAAVVPAIAAETTAAMSALFLSPPLPRVAQHERRAGQHRRERHRPTSVASRCRTDR